MPVRNDAASNRFGQDTIIVLTQPTHLVSHGGLQKKGL